MTMIRNFAIAALAALSILGSVATAFAADSTPNRTVYPNMLINERITVKISPNELYHENYFGIPYGRGIESYYEHFEGRHCYTDNVRKTPLDYHPAPSDVRYTTTVDERVLWTGVIIDCRGLGISASQSPVILDEIGRRLYGSRLIERAIATSNGVVGYASGFSDRAALARAGSNPVIVRAIGVRDGINPVVDQADGSLIVASGIEVHLMEGHANVVFVR